MYFPRETLGFIPQVGTCKPKQKELALSGFQHRFHLLLYKEDKLLLDCKVSLAFIPFHQTPRFTETSSSIPWGLTPTRLSEFRESGFPKSLCSAGIPGPESSHQAKWVNTRVVLKMGSQVREPSPLADAPMPTCRPQCTIAETIRLFSVSVSTKMVFVTRLMSIACLGNHT